MTTVEELRAAVLRTQKRLLELEERLERLENITKAFLKLEMMDADDDDAGSPS